MSGEIVYYPKKAHPCGPNEYGYWYDYWDEPEGTVIQCPECGRSWIAYKPIPPYRHGYMGVLYRRETWFEKWLRRRRME